MPIAQLILQGNFTVDANGGTFLEDSRVRLLEAIDEFGSISKAARQVPLSYKTAWDAVNAMTLMADQALVVRTVGGAGGGGGCLTDFRYLLRRQSMRNSARHLLPLRHNECSNFLDIT